MSSSIYFIHFFAMYCIVDEGILTDNWNIVFVSTKLLLFIVTWLFIDIVQCTYGYTLYIKYRVYSFTKINKRYTLFASSK